MSARCEPRGLRTTARPVAPTRARGALVSVSLVRLGHEKVSSNVRSCPGTPHRGGHVLNVPGSPRGPHAAITAPLVKHVRHVRASTRRLGVQFGHRLANAASLRDPRAAEGRNCSFGST